MHRLPGIGIFTAASAMIVATCTAAPDDAGAPAGTWRGRRGAVDLRTAGAAGDGRTDDTNAIQAILDREVPPYSPSGVQNFYAKQTHPILVIPPGRYRITRTLNLAFRNDLTIVCDGELVWDGPRDGTVIEAVGSSRLRVYGLRIHGQGKAGTFVHISGNGTADGKSALRNARKGKGNVSANRFVDCWFGWQYPESDKAMMDTIPYAKDTPVSWYYSMDDSAFTRCFFQSTGKHGFALSLGSSEIGLSQCNIATPNGIDLHTSATVKLFKCVFTLQANDRGAFFVRPGAHIGEVSMFGCYLEGTTAPLINAADSAEPGSVKAVNVYGGLFAQKSGAEDFVRIPPGWKGALLFSNPRFQEPVGRISAPDCIVHMERLAVGESWRDFGVEIEAAAVTGFQGEAQRGIRVCPEQHVRSLQVRLGDVGHIPWSRHMDGLLANAAGPGGSAVRVLLPADATIRTDHVIDGDVEITSGSNKQRPVLNIEGVLRVRSGGRLIIRGVDVHFDAPDRVLNQDGHVRLEGGTVSGPGPEVCLCRHDGGTTVVHDIVLREGGAVRVSDPYAVGNVILGNLRFTGNETAVSTGGCRLPGVSIRVASESIPEHGSWDVGTVVIPPHPRPGQTAGWVCVRTGVPGVWEPLGLSQP